jgi:hypothetical protein
VAALLAVASMCALVVGIAPGPARALVVGHLRLAIRSDATFSSYDWTATHEQVVILQSWDVADLYRLKAANPKVKVLMYKNASAVTNSAASDGRHCTGVSYGQAAANGWLLRNQGGSPFAFLDYPWLYAADIGSPGYQQAWADNVLADIGSDPWDGVFIDDVNPTIRYHYCVSCVAKYPTDDQYSAATQSFVRDVGPRLQAAGKLAIANIGSWSAYASSVDPWLNWLSGAMDENFLKWGDEPGTGYASPGVWATQLDEVKNTEAKGKLFIGITKSSAGDVRAAVYGYATELLASNGHSVFTLAAGGAGEPWFREYGYDLGVPAGPQHADGAGVHERRFSRGLVLVNPTTSTQTVSLHGIYSGSGVHRARTVTMAPQSGLVLVRQHRRHHRHHRHRHHRRHHRHHRRHHRHHRRHHRRHHHRHRARRA